MGMAMCFNNERTFKKIRFISKLCLLSKSIEFLLTNIAIHSCTGQMNNNGTNESKTHKKGKYFKQHCMEDKAIMPGRNFETGIQYHLPMKAKGGLTNLKWSTNGLSVRQSLTDVAHPIAPGTKCLTPKTYDRG